MFQPSKMVETVFLCQMFHELFLFKSGTPCRSPQSCQRCFFNDSYFVIAVNEGGKEGGRGGV